jgi:hypothetical protein
MFTTPNVRAGLKAISLRVEESEDGDRRVADCTFVVDPFTRALAGELDPLVAEHVFLPGTLKGPAFETDVPRHEVLDISFDLGIPPQRLDLRIALDMPESALVLPYLTIRKLRVTRPKPDKPKIVCSFVAGFDIDEPDPLAAMVQQLGRWSSDLRAVRASSPVRACLKRSPIWWRRSPRETD